MSNERSDMEKLARRLYRTHKSILDLVTGQKTDTGFGSAIRNLFGDDPMAGKHVRLGNRRFVYVAGKANLVSFLPKRWLDELERGKGQWLGCERWWAGHPLIVLVEARASDDGVTGSLKLHAEVGPVADHKARRRLIEAIASEAAARGLKRIRFQPGAADQGRLYTRFLDDNTSVLDAIGDADEIETKLLQLVAKFEPEFDLIADALGRRVPQDGALSSDRRGG